MQSILDEETTKTRATRIVLKATDYYVRFMPQDSIQLATLAQIQNGFYGSFDWWKWHDQMKKFGVVSNQLVDLIFYYPNRMTFDARDILNATETTVYLDQPTLINKKMEASAFSLD